MADESIPPSEPMYQQGKRERRLSVRIATGEFIHCQPRGRLGASDMDNVCFARVRNVSRAGMSMTMIQPFELGTELLVELSDRANALLRLLPVRVIHATPERKRRWIIGCQFVFPLSEEEFLALVGT